MVFLFIMVVNIMCIAVYGIYQVKFPFYVLKLTFLNVPQLYIYFLHNYNIKRNQISHMLLLDTLLSLLLRHLRITEL